MTGTPPLESVLRTLSTHLQPLFDPFSALMAILPAADLGKLCRLPFLPAFELFMVWGMVGRAPKQRVVEASGTA